ncbi:putative voltage-gated potassium channel subunit beta [Phytophthora citrophthora]|uniref:Voltage-gated potassium channel subunit beta n=1 Tax=Phytophthora citrophthora TaxID=4793 RepID=A0AAD9FY28_9STRA|nr:putative voltage-gated potassium channel subunit beta [Phytophthora citrophthora]KAK1928836.1 putative voltage-gated potassium channel subunit beta [Phytophthora citrophthora]
MTETTMTYHFMGNSGLLVSKLALGSWMQNNEKQTPELWYEMMKTAFQHGVNFFDNAESYGRGQAEENMGAAINKGVEEGVWSRQDLVITTKLFNGHKGFGNCGPNDTGLGRKHIVEGMKSSLARLQLDYVDVVFCHRQDPYTPIEETVRAMNYLIEQGWAFYWGTSEWLATDIQEACEIADRLGLIRPIVEQPQYNIFERNKVEFEFLDLFKKHKLGLTTWSPLAYGTLTGKYTTGLPTDSRFTTPMFKEGPLLEGFTEHVAMADQLKPIAAELGCTLAQLSIAWCVSNENVSTVLVGASRPEQLKENLKALLYVDKVTPEVKAKIDAIVQFVPKVPAIDRYCFARKFFL